MQLGRCLVDLLVSPLGSSDSRSTAHQHRRRPQSHTQACGWSGLGIGREPLCHWYRWYVVQHLGNRAGYQAWPLPYSSIELYRRFISLVWQPAYLTLCRSTQAGLGIVDSFSCEQSPYSTVCAAEVGPGMRLAAGGSGVGWTERAARSRPDKCEAVRCLQ